VSALEADQSGDGPPVVEPRLLGALGQADTFVMPQARGAVLVMLALCVTAGAARQSQPSVSFTIIAGKQFGPVDETTTRADLQTLFRGAVKDGDVHIGEGICTSGTKVLPGTPDELDVAWQDAARSRVSFVRTTTAGGRWRTARGVRVGTTLTELTRIAGKVLTFSGFGWDYGGGLAWTEPAGSLGLRLTLTRDEAFAKLPRADEIYGDREVRSDHPVIQRARITVDEITMSWGGHAGEHDCG
jgi:hypothetical protein